MGREKDSYDEIESEIRRLLIAAKPGNAVARRQRRGEAFASDR